MTETVWLNVDLTPATYIGVHGSAAEVHACTRRERVMWAFLHGLAYLAGVQHRIGGDRWWKHYQKHDEAGVAGCRWELLAVAWFYALPIATVVTVAWLAWRILT